MLEITDYGVPAQHVRDDQCRHFATYSICYLFHLPMCRYGPGDWSRRMMGLCSHPRSVHRHPQPAALRGLSLRGYHHWKRSRRTVGLCAHPRSFHRRTQPAAL